MDITKIYHDSNGNKRSILQMLRDEPGWAANRLQEGEKAIASLSLANELIDSLYGSGCLDTQREKMVQKYLCS